MPFSHLYKLGAAQSEGFLASTGRAGAILTRIILDTRRQAASFAVPMGSIPFGQSLIQAN
ncbi:hypothetical protein GCM10027098_12790 [Bowmanella dokdonensis]